MVIMVVNDSEITLSSLLLQFMENGQGDLIILCDRVLVLSWFQIL